MDRFTYFLLGIRDKSYFWKAWALRAFAKSNVLSLEEGQAIFDRQFKDGVFQHHEKHYPYELLADGEKLCFIDPKTQAVVYIKNATTKEPLLNPNESIVVPKGIVENITEKTLTTVGRVLFNQYCVAFPFGNRIPFTNGKIDFKDIEKHIARLLLDEPKEGESHDPAAIYPSMMDNYYVGTGMVSGLNNICVPSMTPYTLTPAPKAVALARKLFKEHAHELNDPLVSSRIWSQIKELDMEYIKQDPEYGFLIKDKHFDVVRKKMFYCYGEEWSLDGKEMTFITKPLKDGVDTKNLPAVYNGTRDGSFSRGSLTALAGVGTKNAIRSTSGAMVSMDDCGTTETLAVRVREGNYKMYVDQYILENGEIVLLTEDNIESYIGKIIFQRSMAYCNAPENDSCAVCFGKAIADRENTLSAETTAVTAGFMGTFMSAMHGTVYKVKDYDLATAFGQ